MPISINWTSSLVAKMLLTSILATLFFFTLLLACYHHRRKVRSVNNLPSGPRGLPLVGNVHQLMVSNPYWKLNQWAKQYGKLYTIQLGMSPALVISDVKLMKKILNTYLCTGKFCTDTHLRLSQGPYGVFNSEGEAWTEQRYLCVQTLKQFGFGNKRMETLILAECENVCKWLSSEDQVITNSFVHIQPIFVQAVINTLWTMISGTRITLGDPKMVELMKRLMETLQGTLKTGLFFLPWLKYLAPDLSGYTAFDKACLDVYQYIENEFLEHQKTLVAGAPRDLIDVYIEYAEGDALKRKHVLGTVVELFVAGSETTAATLTWALFYVCQNPEIQRKLHEEIDSILEGHSPTLDHKSRMPFTEAVLLETLRMSSLAPIGAPHQVMDDVDIEELRLSKGLLLIPNSYSVHYDNNIWGDPEVFKPDRFLGESRDQLMEHLVPFQVGKRQCLGEPLAKDILFIFVAKLFQQFHVHPDPNIKPEEYFSPDVGGFLLPQSLGLKMEQRQ